METWSLLCGEHPILVKRLNVKVQKSSDKGEKMEGWWSSPDLGCKRSSAQTCMTPSLAQFLSLATNSNLPNIFSSLKLIVNIG